MLPEQHGKATLKFVEREHVTRHQQGYRSGLYSEMYIETTFICYGKGPGDDCWVNVKPGVFKKWANSLHICTESLKDLDNMRD